MARRRLGQRLLAPFMPPVNTIRAYRRGDVLPDLIAGLTVSVVDLPQSMAFAVIAGVPPVYGLYTAIFLAFFGGLFTSSRFLSVGPTNTQSLLIAAIVSRITNDPADYVRLVIALSLIKGVIQLAFAAARMGRLVRYVSRSVMIGFTAGAGVLIFLEQVPSFLGLAGPIERSGLPGAAGKVQGIIEHLGTTAPVVVAFGAGALLVLIVARRMPEWVPGPLLAVAGGAVGVWATGVDVPTVGSLPRGLPSLALPDFSIGELEALLSGALAIGLLGMLESVAIAKSIADRTGQRISADQEFFGQGIANVLGSFLHCMPGSGSFSRTALQHAVGARTRMASVVCAASNAAIFLLLAPLARYIPLSVLAGILFYVAYTLIDGATVVRIIRASPVDAVVCLGTFGAALLLPLAYAIYAGIFLNIALYMRQASQLHVTALNEVERGVFHEGPVELENRDVLFLQVEGDLFFGLADDLAQQLRAIANSEVQVVVFRLKRTHFMDASVLLVFDRFVRRMHAREGHVVLCGVRPKLRDRLRRFGLVKLIGDDNVFAASRGGFRSAKQALAHARVLTGQPATRPPRRRDYQI